MSAHAYAHEVQGLGEDILSIVYLKLSMQAVIIKQQQSDTFHMAIPRQRMVLGREAGGKQYFDRTLTDMVALLA